MLFSLFDQRLDMRGKPSARRWRWDGALLAYLILLWLTAGFTPCLAGDDRSAMAPADTSSPRTTLTTFIDACNEFNQLRLSERYLDRDSPRFRPVVRRILDCLDVSQLPAYARIDQAGEAAVCLKEVLDRVELPPLAEIPGSEEVAAAETKDSEPLLRWRIPGTRIVIARVLEGPRRHEYLFSPGTVERAPDYFADVAALPYRTAAVSTNGQYRPDVSEGLKRWYGSAPGNRVMAVLVDRLPDWSKDRLRGAALWQWAGLFLSILVSLLLISVLYRFQRKRAREFRATNLFRYFLTLWFPVVVISVPIILKLFARDFLGLRGAPLYVVDVTANVSVLLAVPVLIFALSNRIAETLISSPNMNPRGLDAQFVRIVSKLTAVVASVAVLLEGGQNLGIPLTTLLASAGVGGLAVALAAQDTLKNLFGTITLMADKPFRVGERIVIGKYDGIVEDIGLRSTRIRLLTGHQATIPNDELASSDIENVGRRPYIRRVADLHVPLDTPREKIETVLGRIRESLCNHEGHHADFPPRVFFNEFNPDSFNIRIIYWYHPPDYWKFLAFAERLNLEIFRAFEEQDVTFSRAVRLSSVSATGHASASVAAASSDLGSQMTDPPA